jgi:pimeloyl-ACP methyl ester carboxylesterase
MIALAASASAARSRHPKAPKYSWNDYARPHQLVDIGGGRHINFFCLGSGTPTVILDGGLGNDISAWRKVHAQLASRTRVCAYDRAGNGFSDAGPEPRSAAALSADLERLIKTARLQPPYLIVGASIAGLHTRLFVDRHLAEIAGVVLVDPSFEHQVARYEAATPAYRASALQQIATYRGCIRQLAPGLPPRDSSIWKDCIGDPEPDLPAEVNLALARRITPDNYRMALSELLQFEGPSADEIDRSRRSWGDLPLFVLTAGGTSVAKGDDAVRLRLWIQAHDRIAKLSTRGVNRIVPNATHHIQLTRPDAVITAVNEVIDESKARRR